MLLGKEKTIPILAMIVLVVGIFSTLYVHAAQVNKDTVLINDQEFSIDEIFELSASKIIQTDEGEKSGISLEDLIQKTSTDCASCHEYTIKAKDGYQQTIPWSVMKKGILTKESQVFFPDTAHSLWVYDVVEIGAR